MSGIYNMINGVNPATFLILPMLGKHAEEYPRFRDCFVSEEKTILVLTRVGGDNRNDGFGEEELYKSPYFIKTWDADWDSTYGYYEFKVPDEWKTDFELMMEGNKPSDAYIEQICKVYPKLKEQIKNLFSEDN